MRTKELAGVPHGFRSTLRTWLTDNTDIPFEVAEMIIAHKTGSKVARAYNRTDYLDQRRPYMEMWAEFLVSITRVMNDKANAVFVLWTASGLPDWPGANWPVLSRAFWLVCIGVIVALVEWWW